MTDGFFIDIEAKGVLLAGGSVAAETVLELAVRAFEEIAGLIEREIRREAPIGATGELRGSVAHLVQGRTLDALRGEVAVTADHAPAVEFGRERGLMPPWGEDSPLFRWVRWKLGIGGAETARVSFLIARAISREGTKGSGFFDRSLKQSQGAVGARIRRLESEIAERLSG